MSITRKEVLTNKYEELKSKLQLYVNKDMFPSLNDFDIIDVISFIKLYFPRDYYIFLEILIIIKQLKV